MINTDIIIPTYGNEQFTIKCLESIRAYTKDYNIVWVDNCSTKESRQLILDELKNHTSYKTIWLDRNYGFVKAVNEGLKYSKNKYVVLQNNDTEVTKGWLELLKYPLENNKYIVASGPMTSDVDSWQSWKNVKKHHYPTMPDLSGKTNEEIRAMLLKLFGNTYREVPMIAFFSTIFKRSIFDEIGMLDTIFKTGLGDDDDVCMRITNVGKKVVFMPGVYVLHHHRTTFKSVFGVDKIKEMQTTNLQIFRDKHGL